MSIVDIENVYDIHVQTKMYKPQDHTPVVVSCQLTCVGYTSCTIEDYREYLRYLMNQKAVTESGIESSRQAYAEMQSTIDKFRSLTTELSDNHLNMETTIRLIQREVPNLPEQMRVYTRRLAEYNNKLYDVLQRMRDI